MSEQGEEQLLHCGPVDESEWSALELANARSAALHFKALAETAADEIASLRAQLTEWQDDYAALKARAKEVVAPFAMLADLDAKNMHGLESVYPMVAAGRLHDAKQFLSALTAEASHE